MPRMTKCILNAKEVSVSEALQLRDESRRGKRLVPHFVCDKCGRLSDPIKQVVMRKLISSIWKEILTAPKVILLDSRYSMSMYQKIRFTEIEAKVPKKSGIYEIYTDSGIALKVGISSNIRKRLLQHRASRQNRLKLKPGGNRLNPNDVLSKESILTKHLYYDKTITKEYILTAENGRKAFLSDKCYIRFKETETKAEARIIEKQLEMSCQFLYKGRVKKM